MNGLGGKAAVVTGGSRGIGAAIARRLARDGMYVVAVARNLEKLQQVCNEIAGREGSAEPVSCARASVSPLPNRFITAASSKSGRKARPWSHNETRTAPSPSRWVTIPIAMITVQGSNLTARTPAPIASA